MYNIDETGVSTVVQSPNTVAPIGMKQVGQAVSGECVNITAICMIINSVRNTVVFPSLHDLVIFGAPPGSLELVNIPQSSWITGPLVLKALEHVKKHTRISKEDHIILPMDNHERHCPLDSILYARENGITLVTFPLHCSDRLQPLDVGVMGPFKGKLRIAQHDWMTANRGKVITVHGLTSLTNAAYQASFTAKNIAAAFAKSGTWPFSRLAFSDEDFEPSSVTRMEKEFHSQAIPVPSASTPVKQAISGTSKNSLSPEDVCPFPKPGPRCNRRQRKKVKSRILTDSPIKDHIEQEAFVKAAVKKKYCKGAKSYRNKI